MSEKKFGGASEGQGKNELTAEEEAQYAAFMEDHPDAEKPPAAVKESDPRVAEFQALVASFEAEYPLEELTAIIDLKAADAPNHPIREPARKALIAVHTMMKSLEGHPQSGKFYADYKRLSRAVGMINGGKVDHNR